MAYSRETDWEALVKYLSESDTNRGRGSKFERLIKAYLENDGEFKHHYVKVWFWSDFARDILHDKIIDIGIDLVAEDRFGGYTSIQCKFDGSFGRSLRKEEVDSFFAASNVPYGKVEFRHKLIATTASNSSPNLDDYMKRDPSIKLIDLEKLKASNLNWTHYCTEGEEARARDKHALREHQQDAINSIIEGFKTADRGRVIMACGTGKTLVGLRYIEKHVPSDSLVLIAMPSIALISQTIREYLHHNQTDDIFPVGVCSQKIQHKKAFGDDEDEGDSSGQALVHPTTTKSKELLEILSKAESHHRRIIFTTYQSMQVIAEAQAKYGLEDFALIIADEAHRTAGANQLDKGETAFTLIHDREETTGEKAKIKGDKRLYMTATPRIFNDNSKDRAEKKNVFLYSMSDENIFGKIFYDLSFGKAVTKELLSDYKVIVAVVDESVALESFTKLDEGDSNLITMREAAKFVALHKAIAKKDLLDVIDEQKQGKDVAASAKWEINDKNPMKRIINYAPSIKISRIIENLLPKFSEAAGTGIGIGIKHIDGTMNMLKRDGLIGYLHGSDKPDDSSKVIHDKDGVVIQPNQSRILTNAKCLTEGIDVPTLDGVCFFSKKKSITDIVQAIGRVLRKASGKEYGYIILPVCITDKELDNVDYAVRNNNDFEAIWQVIAALKAHDQSFADEADYRHKIKVLDFRDKPKDKKTPNADGEQLALPLADKIFNAIVDIGGQRAYWKHWGQEVYEITQSIEKRLRHAIENNDAQRNRFQNLLAGFENHIQKTINEDLLFQTLAQHIVTEPIFEMLFIDSNFKDKSPIVITLNSFLSEIKENIAIELKDLQPAYKNMRGILSDKSPDKREAIIDGIYNEFIKTAFPEIAEQLGIVYTPPKCVNFILNSTEALMQRHFNQSLSNQNVNVLDPFTGTGTFIKRLIESPDIIKDDNLLHKYQNEIHANEIMLLAYHIARLRIEDAFNNRYNGDYIGFQNAVYGDTFDSFKQQIDSHDRMAGIGALRRKQDSQDITVIIGNPPYFAKRKSTMNKNKNALHPGLRLKLRETYIKHSKAKNPNSLYDPYVKAIRWASDRIGDKGIISFIINGSFIDSPTGSGIRACLEKDFSHVYFFNLKGNRRKGNPSTPEGENVFGGSSGVTIAIIHLIKDGNQINLIKDGEEFKNKKGKKAEIFYYEIGDYLKAEEKIKFLEDSESITKLNNGQPIDPNKYHSWINQENENFEKYIQIGSKDKTALKVSNLIFDDRYTTGIKSCRDSWLFNFDKNELTKNINLHIDTYMKDREKVERIPNFDTENKLCNDKKKIKYTDGLKKCLTRKDVINFDAKKIRKCLYYPFQIKYAYCEPKLIEREYQTKRCIPVHATDNVLICTSRLANSNEFFALATNYLPSVNMGGGGQCYSLCYYPKQTASDLAGKGTPERIDGINDWTLEAFQKQYKSPDITKLDIFHYIYGIFHSPIYKKHFANNLFKHEPRIPFVKKTDDFHAFCKAGNDLMQIHLNYETAEPYADLKEHGSNMLDDYGSGKFYEVTKMDFANRGKGKDKTAIRFNDFITLDNIPLKAYEYIVDGKSAIEWIMSNYQIKTDKDTGITQDPNTYSDDPKYIYNLLKRIITVSLQSVDIINNLPKLDINEKSKYYTQT